MTETAREQREAIKVLIQDAQNCLIELRDTIAEMENVAEKLLMPAVDEQEHAPKVKKIKYAEAEAPIEYIEQPSYRRACSKCRQPGHRANNCPKESSNA